MSYPTLEQTNPASELSRPRDALARADHQAPNGALALAKALGWFSIGLGLGELMMPRQLGRAIGVGQRDTLLPILGLREIASGIGILTQSDPTNAIRARVAGDMMDLALLGAALTSPRSDPARVATATAAVLGVTALDIACSRQLSQSPTSARRRSRPGAIRVSKSIAVNRPVEELYSYWRKLENLPQVMRFLESVTETDGRNSHWVARGPADAKIEWNAEITTEVANQMIAWESHGDSDVPNRGYVDFKPLPAGRGTVVTVHVEYEPPAGRLGAAVAKLFGRSPDHEIEVDLRRWKQVVETGEVATTEGQPHGKRSAVSRHLP